MRTKFLLFFSGLLLIGTGACNKDEHLMPVPGDAKVKRIMIYFTKDFSKDGFITSEYEYDSESRIKRVTAPMYDAGKIVGIISYDDYIYNATGQLIRKENYNSNIYAENGFINLVNYTYDYDSDGNLVKETSEYPQMARSTFKIYDYSYGLQARVKYYNYKGEVESTVVYEYDNLNRRVTEKTYGPDNSLLATTKNTYNGMLLIRSDVYNGDIYYRKIVRSYDDMGNLVVLESKELSPVSSAMSYFSKYEY